MRPILRLAWMIVWLVLAAGVASFAISNKSVASLALWPFETSLLLPIWAAVLGALGSGLLAGAILVWLAGLAQRARLSRQARQIAKLEAELASLRDRLDMQSADEMAANRPAEQAALPKK